MPYDDPLCIYEALVSMICVLFIVALFLYTQEYPLDPIIVYLIKIFEVEARIMISMKKNPEKLQVQALKLLF